MKSSLKTSKRPTKPIELPTRKPSKKPRFPTQNPEKAAFPIKPIPQSRKNGRLDPDRGRNYNTSWSMEPILTLQYSEWLVAERLMKKLPACEGYSVYAPLSRQEQGVDLLISRRASGVTHTAALQVKYSRSYEKPPNAPFRFEISFNNFSVSERADFFVLTGLYPNVTGRGGGPRSSWWLSLMLLFAREEMTALLSSLQTRKGVPETRFYFGFDHPIKKIVLTRGAPEHRDFTGSSLESRLHLLKQHLNPT